MSRPAIKTAIPKRRYKFGEFSVVVLGEIDSSDGINYCFILGVIREGESEPGLYITAEKNGSEHKLSDALSMRVIMRDGEELVGTSDRWSDLEQFTADALAAAVRILDLPGEQPFRLM